MKRGANKSLKAWVSFVKRVKSEEHKKGNKISYREAISVAKKRKDNGEKWMRGGDEPREKDDKDKDDKEDDEELSLDDNMFAPPQTPENDAEDGRTGNGNMSGGRRRTRRRGRGRSRSRGRGRGRGRSRGRSRGRGRGRS